MTSDPTSPEKVASIDIGTNTILLLIAKVEGGRIHPLREIETVARLGEGLQKNGILLKEAMDRGIQTLAQYLKWSQEMGIQEIFVAGTSALREAKNSEDFLKSAKEKLDLSIEVISGEEEARLSFLAVARDLKENEKTILVVDVGGGSTELILGKGDQIRQWMSLPAGSVRFTEQFFRSDPVEEEDWAKVERRIKELLVQLPHPQETITMVAVGGTATTLASVEQGLENFVAEKIHGFVLDQELPTAQMKGLRENPNQACQFHQA